MRRRILIIAQPVAPFGGSHATRVNGLAEALMTAGCSVALLSTTLHRGAPLLDWSGEEQVRGAKIYRAFCGPLHYLSYRKNERRARAGAPAQRHLSEGQGRLKNYMVPDTFVEWVPFASLQLRRILAEFNPTEVVSSAAPYSAHLIGLMARAFSSVPWVADFGDPWTLENSVRRGRMRLAIEQRLEAAVMERAAAICWTTEATRQAYTKLYPRRAAAMHVLRMAFRPKDFVQPRVSGGKRSGVVLLYAGRLNPEHRDVSRFLDAYQELQADVAPKLWVAGTELGLLLREVERRALPDVEFIGSLEHREFVRRLQEADVLLLFGNSSPLQVPGKLFQYFGARRPILYFKNMPDDVRDETEELMAEYGLPYFAVSSSGCVNVSVIAEFLRGAHTYVAPATGNMDHSWNARAKDLLQILDMCHRLTSRQSAG